MVPRRACHRPPVEQLVAQSPGEPGSMSDQVPAGAGGSGGAPSNIGRPLGPVKECQDREPSQVAVEELLRTGDLLAHDLVGDAGGVPLAGEHPGQPPHDGDPVEPLE